MRPIAPSLVDEPKAITLVQPKPKRRPPTYSRRLDGEYAEALDTLGELEPPDPLEEDEDDVFTPRAQEPDMPSVGDTTINGGTIVGVANDGTITAIDTAPAPDPPTAGPGTLPGTETGLDCRSCGARGTARWRHGPLSKLCVECAAPVRERMSEAQTTSAKTKARRERERREEEAARAEVAARTPEARLASWREEMQLPPAPWDGAASWPVSPAETVGQLARRIEALRIELADACEQLEAAVKVLVNL
jgi:hypothetical protein